MTSLNQYGWQRYRQSCSPVTIPNDLTLGRIVSIKGFKYYTMTANGELACELSGRLLNLSPHTQHPKTGDWVTLMVYDTIGYVIDVLPRLNELSRRGAGVATQRQLLATNIDAALVVQGLDRDFNIMRLERYLVQLAACNVAAVVILNKSDLVNDTQPYTHAVRTLQRDCRVVCCSTMTGEGLDTLKHELLRPAHTYVLIGSSGVGKSSILNALLDESVQTVGSTSESNEKGRHTTATRDLFLLPGGSLLVDTPGMREFGVTGSGDSSSELFPAIRELAIHCRYSDCQHLDEPGCAVRIAVRERSLAQEIYDSYIKLRKEMRRFETDVSEKKRLNKQFGKITREAKDHRRKYKY